MTMARVPQELWISHDQMIQPAAAWKYLVLARVLVRLWRTSTQHNNGNVLAAQANRSGGT